LGIIESVKKEKIDWGERTSPHTNDLFEEKKGKRGTGRKSKVLLPLEGASLKS